MVTEQEALARMIAPGTPRPGKWRQGVIQIHVTRACDNACFNCTQGSNLAGKPVFITVENFEKAVLSLKGYFGVVGVFGGNPALHPNFDVLCEILCDHIPFEQRGLWCNHPRGWGKVMARTFNPTVSNLNVHLSQEAWDEFKRDWPQSMPIRQSLTQDSRHSPCYVAMKDVLRTVCPECQGNGGWFNGSDGNTYLSAEQGIAGEQDWQRCPTCFGANTVYDEEKAWGLISNCDINQHWSAMIGQFRGEVRAWFCEIAGAQSILHQDEPDYPDTGLDPTKWYQYASERAYDNPDDVSTGAIRWWQRQMHHFAPQVRKHCHDCGVPLRGYGELAMAADGKEQVSATHQGIYKPKRVGRRIELVTLPEQLGKPLERTTHYIQNASV